MAERRLLWAMVGGGEALGLVDVSRASMGSFQASPPLVFGLIFRKRQVAGKFLVMAQKRQSPGDPLFHVLCVIYMGNTLETAPKRGTWMNVKG